MFDLPPLSDPYLFYPLWSSGLRRNDTFAFIFISAAATVAIAAGRCNNVFCVKKDDFLFNILVMNHKREFPYF